LDLAALELENFRSYSKREFSFLPRGSLIIGPNGCGKTNLLEAIAYTSVGKSIRFNHDEELLHFESGWFRVSGLYNSDLASPLKVALSYGEKRKLLKLDELPVRQLSRLFDVVKVIYCAPEDLLLVNGSPRHRRQYMDLAIAQLYPAYIPVLRNYLHLVEQRNALFKRSYSASEKSSWDNSFAEALHEVLGYRKRYLELVNKAFAEVYQDLFPVAAMLRISYQPVLKLPLDSSPERINAALKELETREKQWQRSLAGAHLDDYEFRYKGRRMRSYASQGQKRIAVIILKLIQASLIERITSIKPILLFDDIFAELDAQHARRIRDCIDNRYQVFIASPKEDVCAIWQGYPVLKLEESDTPSLQPKQESPATQSTSFPPKQESPATNEIACTAPNVEKDDHTVDDLNSSEDSHEA